MFDEDETQHQEKPAMAEVTTRITHELVEKYTKELQNIPIFKKKATKNYQETTEE